MRDPLRPEAREAVLQCRRAGITVRLCSGDNIGTACATAAAAGLFDEQMGDLAMEGPEFRRRVTDGKGDIYLPEFEAIWPRLRVLARCSPQDKHTLVKGLRGQGECVMCTGDSTGDAPALEEADAGLSMGIAGTDVAKTASDLIVMDDNFATVSRVIMWGKHVQNVTRRLVKYQITAAAVVICFSLIAGVLRKRAPFSAAQLLWLNLIVDCIAAVAFALEPPDETKN